MEDDYITDWVALRSKSYAYKTLLGEMDFRCKGISSSLYFDQFLETLMTLKPILVDENKIRTDHHEVQIQTIRKKALSAYDDKRILLEGKTFTYAFGHSKFNNDNMDMI